jgi:predicted flap endonuclease-1-like 5' DNA nuclease
MLYLLQSLSVWVLTAAGLGLIVGLLSWKASAGEEKPGFGLRFFPFALLLAAGATVAGLRWLPGRQGLWLETALLLLAAYLVGCALGCFARGWLSGGGTAPKAAPSARAEAETAAAARSAEETTATRETPPVEWTAETEALARSAAALAASAPTALEVFGAARELLVESEEEIAADKSPPLLSPPASASRPESGEADNLRLIQGVDEAAARRLRDLGVWRFEQIADWTPSQQQWISCELPPIGPQVLRFWIAQARLLAGGVETEFARVLRQGEGRRAFPEAPLDEAAAAHFLAALPQPIAPHATDEIYAGLRPLALLLPPYGEQDDLCQLSGVEAATAQRLNALGVWIYGQIARWSDENARWIGSYLAFPGRVEAENWVAQARERVRDGEAI